MTLSARAQAILHLFRRWTALEKIIRPSRAWLSKWLKCSIRSVQTALNELYKSALVEVEHRYRRSSIFRLCTALCTAVRKPELVVSTIEALSPLVIFRNVYSTLRSKPKKRPEPITDFYECMRLVRSGVNFEEAKQRATA